MKRAVSVLLCLALISSFFASCGKKEIQSGSNADVEKEFSSVTTVKEKEKEDSSKKTASEKTSSPKTKSQKSKSGASDKQTDESKAVNSKSKSTVSRSFTVSESVVETVNPNASIGIGVYHFEPNWCFNYAESKAKATNEQKLEEFRDVISAGYFNTVMCSNDWVKRQEFWDICIEYQISVWMTAYTFFDSKKKTIEEYMKPFDESVALIKSHPEWDALFLGFHYEEPLWRGQTNADFLLQTQKFYQKYGKRNFIVLATGEFSDSEGNAMQIKMDASDMRKIHPDAMKYLTDVSFDSYSVDVRSEEENPSLGNGSYIDKMHAQFPGIVDGRSYYKVLAQELVRISGHEVNIWFFPCAYHTNTWGGYYTDEDYCLAHLNCMRELALDFEHVGGIFLYTYKSFREDNADKAMESRLIVRSESGGYKLRPNDEKWGRYSQRLKEITAEFRTKDGNVVVTI